MNFKTSINQLPLNDCSIFIRNGFSIKQDKNTGGISITRIETISNGVINPNKVGHAGLFDEEKYEDYFLQEGDILVSHINSIEHLGKTAIYENHYGKLIHGMNLLCIRPDPKVVNSKYLHYFLKSKYFKKQLPKIVNNSVNQSSFSVTNFRSKIFVPILPLDEQKKIADILDQSNFLCKKRKQAIDLFKEYIKSVFLEMFGDPILNPKGWDKKELRHFGEIVTGNTPSRNDAENFDSHFIEWIKTDNIVEDHTYLTKASEYLSETGLKKARFVSPGAILIACIAGSIASIGRVAIANRKVSFNQQINAIQPNKIVNSMFLYWLLKNSRAYIQRHATKGMKRILTKGEFEKIMMIIPPLELQDKFARFVEDTDKLKQKMIEQSSELDNQFHALMQKHFSPN